MIPRSNRIGSRYLPPLLMDVASQFGENAAGAFNISEGGEFGVRNHLLLRFMLSLFFILSLRNYRLLEILVTNWTPGVMTSLILLELSSCSLCSTCSAGHDFSHYDWRCWWPDCGAEDRTCSTTSRTGWQRHSRQHQSDFSLQCVCVLPVYWQSAGTADGLIFGRNYVDGLPAYDSWQPRWRFSKSPVLDCQTWPLHGLTPSQVHMTCGWLRCEILRFLILSTSSCVESCRGVLWRTYVLLLEMLEGLIDQG